MNETKWWVLSAVVTELLGAAMIARGLSLEKPSKWVRGRGTGRWGIEPNADLNYAAGSTDAGVGFGVLLVGLALQGIAAVDTSAKGSGWMLVIPAAVGILAVALARCWRRHRELAVMGVRIEELVVDARWPEADWQSIVHSYSRALEQAGRGRSEGEDAWAHLDRIYGESAWLPDRAARGMRQSYDTNLSITYLDELGDLWLPWFVRADRPAEVIHDLDRSLARQLRVRDVVDDGAFRPALEEKYEHEGRTWTHLERIEDYKRQWEGLNSLSPGRFPASRTPDGPVLRDGCHRACAVYALNPPDWRIDLKVTDPSPDDPDTQPGPRDAALGRSRS